MDIEQLTCPQLLSNETLKQILHERCIEVPGGIQSFDKDKLINIYNRIALPYSQRKYNNKRLLEKHLNHLRLSRQITTINYINNKHLSKNAINDLENDDNKKNKNINNEFENGKLHSAINNSDNLQLLNKRIRLFNSTQKTSKVEEQLNEQKRKSNVSLNTDSKKRQKITWP